MDKRVLCIALIALLFAFSVPLEAQQATKIPRIGFVTGGSTATGSQIQAFRRGLRDFGYIEGKTILVEYRDLESRENRIRDRSHARRGHEPRY